MAPKKGGGAAKARPKASAGKKSKDELWAASQLEKLEAQRSGGPDFLQEPHAWHAGQLEYVISCLQDLSLKAVPEQLRDDVEFYVSQFDGQETAEEDFYVDRDVYDEVLAASRSSAAGVEPGEAPYVRATASQAELAAAEELKAWPDASPAGLAALRKRLAAQEASAEVQQHGLTKLGALLAEANAGAGAGSDGSAAAAAHELTPGIVGAMRRFPRDAGVQKAGCGALRGVVKSAGGCPVVCDAGGAELAARAIKALLSDVEVCRAGASLLYAMVQETDATSPERLVMKSAGYDAILREALAKHPTDHGLDWAVRVAMPELRA